MTILIFRTFRETTPVEAYLVPGGNGAASLVVSDRDHCIWHNYAAPTEDLIQLLEELLRQAQLIRAGGNPLAEGGDLE